jgi:hypothetical protein
MPLSFPPPLPATSSPRPAPQSGYRIICLGGYDFSSNGDSWPDVAQIPPVLGDFVQSRNGSIKKIIQIIHSADYNGPATILMLGDDNTSVTASESGSTSEVY